MNENENGNENENANEISMQTDDLDDPLPIPSPSLWNAMVIIIMRMSIEQLWLGFSISLLYGIQ